MSFFALLQDAYAKIFRGQRIISMGQTCPTNCGVVVVRRVTIIAAVSRHHLAGDADISPKAKLTSTSVRCLNGAI